MSSRRPARSGGSRSGSNPRRAVVKDEPHDDDDELRARNNPTAVTSSTETKPPPAAQDKPDAGHPDDEENDKVVREIGVFISPSLSSTLTLVQFPLQPATPGPAPTPPGKNQRAPPLPPPPPLPEAARVKPRHNILELDYNVPTHDFSNHRSIPDALHLIQRTYTSSTVDPVTHMALGRFNLSGERLDIVPLQKSVMQMRPTFRHVDALYDDGTPEEPAKEDAATTSEPLKFKKKESDRAALARRSSYAYKKASEAAEEWTDLMVQPMGTEEYRKTSREVVTSRKNATLKFVKKGGKSSSKKKKGGAGADGSYAYIKSLNYRPMADLVDEEEDQFESLVSLELPPEEGENRSNDDNDNDSQLLDDVLMEGEKDSAKQTLQERKMQRRAEALKELTCRITQLLHSGYGGPTPYLILRSKYPKHLIEDDQLLLEALSSCAVLVRGNFVLKSSLMVDLSDAVRDARDLILYLLNRDGIVLREKLSAAFDLTDDKKKMELEDDDEENNKDDNDDDNGKKGDKDTVTHDILESLLHQVARKDVNSWVSKVDDNYVDFAADATASSEEVFDDGGVRASNIADFHATYWERKGEILEELIQRYDYSVGVGGEGDGDDVIDEDGRADDYDEEMMEDQVIEEV